MLKLSSPPGRANPAAFAAGQYAERMASGYYVHAAALHVATDPRAAALAPPVRPGQRVSTGFVPTKFGPDHAFHFWHYLNQARTMPAYAEDLKRIWLIGAVLAVGDVLQQNAYFDRAPELELVRHVRNGIAHGNRFRIDN